MIAVPSAVMNHLRIVIPRPFRIFFLEGLFLCFPNLHDCSIKHSLNIVKLKINYLINILH